MSRIVIDSESRDPSRPWAHFEPIIDLLARHGNEAIGAKVFLLDKDGWYCQLQKPIDFDLLEIAFEFPNNLVLSRADGAILDSRTWVEIRGGSD